jgi:uncharacterized YccA/Bax inhibitor family protein
MSDEAKWTIAKVAGGLVVGGVTILAIKKVAGAKAGGMVGAALLMVAHEMLDAPISGWIYKQL